MKTFKPLSLILVVIQVYSTSAQQDVSNLWEQISNLERSYESYINWASSIVNPQSFMVFYPKTNDQVVSIVNWAHGTGKHVRAQGHRHGYSPIIVSEQDKSSNTVIVDMQRHMKNLKVANFPVSRAKKLPIVIAQPGATMDEFLTFAEQNGYGIANAPIVGQDVTVGGVLAIGGHGAAISALNEKLQGPVFSFGSVSNLIAELKAVVWDATANQYVLKVFSRSDPDISAFLVHVGRAIITEVSLLVGPNYNQRCISRVDVTEREIFTHPDSPIQPRNTMTALMDIYGRVDVIWYPFVDRPWLKLWDIVNSTKPVGSRLTNVPYNYQFPTTFDNNPQTPGPVFGPQIYQRLIRGLTQTKTWDIWGPSKNTLFYYNVTNTPFVYSGFVVLTSRENMQLVLHDIAQFYRDLSNTYGSQGRYPIDHYIKLRVTGLDDPKETMIPGAVPPLISPTSPALNRPDFNVGVWMNTVTYTNRSYSDQFMVEFEQWAYTRFNGEDGIVRPEWSKNWGHDNTAPFKNITFLREIIPNVFGVAEWNRAISILDKYDPHGVITNEFIRSFMIPYKIQNARVLYQSSSSTLASISSHFTFGSSVNTPLGWVSRK